MKTAILAALAFACVVSTASAVEKRAVQQNPISFAKSQQPETCTASKYGKGDGYHGKRTASGAIFNTYARDPYTVAHKTRPLGSWVTVTNQSNGKSIRAKVTDRGPYVAGRCVDVGEAGANDLGMGGLARVRVD